MSRWPTTPAAWAAAVLLVLATLACAPAEAAGARVWTDEGDGFLKGTHSGTAITADRWLGLAGQRSVLLEPSPTRFVWDLALDSQGTLYIATGNRGKLLRLRRDPDTGDEAVDEFYDFTDPVIFSLALDAQDNLYVATSPGGVIYKLVPQAEDKPQVSVFYDTDGQYVWDMIVGSRGQVYLATGPEGRIYRVEPDGTGALLYDSPDPHVLSLALGPEDTLYAGTNEHGWVYRFSADGSFEVAYDAAEGEVHTMTTDPDGTLYFGTADLGREAKPAEQARAAQAVVSELMRGTGGGGRPSLLAPPSVKFPGEEIQATNALYRLTPTGEVLCLGRFKGLLMLSMTGEGGTIYLGTGNDGRLFTVDAAERLSEVEPRKKDETPPPTPRQVTALAATVTGEARPRLYLGTANPGGVLVLEPGFSPEGTYSSEVFNARFPARWGQLTIQGDLPDEATARVRTRSGHTEKPDDTWAEWSDWLDIKPGAGGGDGVAVASPPARFLQYELRLASTDPQNTPTVSQVRVAYLTSNQPPRVDALTVGRPPQQGRPSPQASAPSGPSQQGPRPSGPPGQQGREPGEKPGLIPIYWKVTDADGDKLTFDLHFRGEGEKRWKLVAEEILANNHNWQTEAVPDGTYYVKLVASDAPANPDSRALSAERISSAFLVDNTPPRIADLRCERSDDTYTLSASVADETSSINSLAYSIDAKEWKSVEPADGIFDERSEQVSVDIGELDPGEHTVTLKATDSRGNTAAAKQVLIVPQN